MKILKEQTVSEVPADQLNAPIKDSLDNLLSAMAEQNSAASPPDLHLYVLLPIIPNLFALPVFATFGELLTRLNELTSPSQLEPPTWRWRICLHWICMHPYLRYLESKKDKSIHESLKSHYEDLLPDEKTRRARYERLPEQEADAASSQSAEERGLRRFESYLKRETLALAHHIVLSFRCNQPVIREFLPRNHVDLVRPKESRTTDRVNAKFLEYLLKEKNIPIPIAAQEMFFTTWKGAGHSMRPLVESLTSFIRDENESEHMSVFVLDRWVKPVVKEILGSKASAMKPHLGLSLFDRILSPLSDPIDELGRAFRPFASPMSSFIEEHKRRFIKEQKGECGVSLEQAVWLDGLLKKLESKRFPSPTAGFFADNGGNPLLKPLYGLLAEAKLADTTLDSINSGFADIQKELMFQMKYVT